MNPTAYEAEYRRRFLYYKPHDKQKLFHRLGADCRERLFLAGNRTGKTFGGVQEMAMHLTGTYPTWWEGHRFDHPINAWAASDTTLTTRDILQKEYLGDENTGDLGAIHNSLVVQKTAARGVANSIDTVWVKHTKGVSTLSFKSYDQGRAKFQGTHRHAIHLDEEPPEDIYSECRLRTTGVGDKTPGIMLMTMTPLRGMTRTVMLFLVPEDGSEAVQNIPHPKTNRVFVQAGWEDNPHISATERASLIAGTPKHELEARQSGIPSLGSGMVYPIAESEIIVDPFPIPENWAQVFGMDFGWQNPTAVIFGAHDRDTDTLYLHKEYYQSQLTPQTHANNLHALGADWMPGVCDPAGQQADKQDGQRLYESYTNHGLSLSLADNSKEAGIQDVLERMQNGRFKVFSTCSSWISEFRLYSRDEKNGLPKKENDHLMDATRYLVRSGLGLATTRRQHESSWGGDSFSPLTL